MRFDKFEIMKWNTEDKRQLAFELLDSIDEEFIQKDIPEWKRELIRERIAKDKDQPGDTINWQELRKKYYSQ